MKTLPMRITHSFFALLAGSLIGIPGQAGAVDTSQWKCEYCPFEAGYRADYEAGVTGVSDDSAYFGDASGYDESGAYANLDGAGTYTNDEYRVSWTLEDLGLDSRFAEVDGANQGIYDYRIAYREIPQRTFITTNTIFRASAPDMLMLPAGWVRAPLTSGFTALGSSLVPIDIESDRSLLEVGGRYVRIRNLTLSADFRRHERDGIDVVGGTFFTSSSLLPRPFDYETDEVELGARYALDRGYVAVGWRLSEFENRFSGFSWENPFSSGFGADIGRLAQPPDNEFQQFSLSGAYGIDWFDTVVGFSAAIGELEQNEAFLPYTINPALVTGSLPRASLNGDVDTANFALSLNSALTDAATVRASFRYDERDNKTLQDDWTRVIADSFVAGDSETNIPYSYERSTFSLVGQYDLTDDVEVSAGYEYKTMDRDFQEVAEQTENSGWGRVRWRPNSIFDVDVRGGVAERGVELYDEAVAISLDQNPLLRKYNLAYRYRQFGELTANITPPDSSVTLTVTGLFADDEYTRSQVGLTDGLELGVTADLGWALSESISVYASGGYENIQADQSGSENFGLPDWRASNDDTFYTFGGGARFRELTDKIDLQVDFVRSDGTSEITVVSASGGPSPFPDLDSTLDYLRLKLVYDYSDRVDITGRLQYQSFSADDWALQGVGPGTIPTVLTLGALPYDDDQVLFGVGFRYKLGKLPDSEQDE
jgi:MtrB/PioB family decaheme-associated outer membrane protein